MKFLDANNFNEGEMDWDSVSRKDWYYIRHRIAELKVSQIAEFNCKKIKKNKKIKKSQETNKS